MKKIFALSDVYLESKIQISSEDNIEELFGQIVTNRIVGTAYANLDLSTLHNDIRKSLEILKTNCEERTSFFKENLEYLSNVLKNVPFKYALLKGAFLSTFLYQHGKRTSNDIDILIESKDVSELQKLLLAHGFIQGYYDSDNKTAIPATRKEVVLSKMNFGETIPFIKIIRGHPFAIDINFSIDYKPSTNVNLIPNLLNHAVLAESEKTKFWTLNKVDFLIHLCCHLYKEATTYDWVSRKRDLMLYKFSDINIFLKNFGNEEYFNAFIERVKQFGFEKECYYTFKNSAIIYPDLMTIKGFETYLEVLKLSDPSFMQQVILPLEKKLFQHNMTFVDWFFCLDRVAQLKEVPYEDETS